jgi:hypothetical protein
MYPVYVVHQGAKLSIANKRLQVEQNGETLLAAPLGQISEVVIFGNVGLTTPAIGALLAEAKDVVFLSEDGRFKGRLVGELTPHVPLRRAQYRRMDEADFGLRLAQGVVAAKLAHQRTLLQRHNRELGNAEIISAIARLGEAVSTVERRTTVGLADRPRRRGHRGLLQRLPPAVRRRMEVRAASPATAARSGQRAAQPGLHPAGQHGARRGAGGRAGPLRRLPARIRLQPAQPGAGPAGRVPAGGGRHRALGLPRRPR